MYRPRFHDWGHGPAAQELRATVLEERETARTRGTSTLPEHIGLLTKDALKQVARWHLSDSFRTAIEDAM